MVDKHVKVKLVADVQNYLSGMREAQKATRETAQASENAAERAEMWGNAASMVGGQLMVVGTAATAGVGLAVNAYAKFDEAMSSVQAATHASAQDMELLTAAARDAGAGTAFSATEAAAGIEELAKAGVSTADILAGGLDGALALAAAGSVDVGFAAETAASAMTQFKLSGGEVTHIADLLAAGAGKAQGGVRELGDALKQSGLVASQMGLSIEETVGGLSAFASAGLMGSDAGTSFKTMLQRLANPSKQAAQQMEALGINAWDAQGNFVGLAEFAGQLQTSMRDLTPEARNAAMSVMFGSDAVRAANALYDQGADGINEWIAAVDDAGYAAKTAWIMQNNLRGDLEKLGGAWDDLMISMGEHADAPLRGLVQTLTNLVDGFAELPGPVQGVIMALGGLTGAAALGAGAFMMIVPKIAETRAAVETLGWTMGPAKAAWSNFLAAMSNPATLLATAGALAVVATGLVLLRQQSEKARRQQVELETAVKSTKSGVENLTLAFENASDGSIIPAVNEAEYSRTMEALGDLKGLMDRLVEQDKSFNLGVEIDLDNNWANATAAIRDYGDELAKLTETDLSNVQTQLRDIQEAYELTGEEMWQFINESPELEQALQKQALEAGVAVGDLASYEERMRFVEFATSETAEATRDLTFVQEGQAQAAQEAAMSNEELADSIRTLDDLMGGLVGTENSFYEAIDAASEAVAENGATIDVTTEAGRANRDALRDLASATTDWAATLAESGESQDVVNSKLSAGREKFIENATAMGYTQAEAEELANKYGLIPGKIETKVTVDAAQAHQEVRSIRNAIDGLAAGVESVMRRAGGRQIGFANADGGIYAYANGGIATSVPTGIYPGGRPVYKFAEPETRWEAFISGKLGQEDRNRRILAEAAARLGMSVTPNADGGIYRYQAGSTVDRSRHVAFDQQFTVNAAGMSVHELGDVIRKVFREELRGSVL